MLNAEGQEDAVVPPRGEAIQAALAVGDVARRLFPAGQTAHVAPFAREGVEDLGGEHSSYNDLVVGRSLPHDHVNQHGPLLAEDGRELPPRLRQGVAHEELHLHVHMGLHLVDEADQPSCRRHREHHLGRQVAEGEVVPLVHRGVKAQERSAVFTVGDLDKVGLV